MPIKYIGKTTFHVGKTLWEIIGNLQSFGVGRIITRGTWERYSEPCYYKICEVDAYANEGVRKVKVLAEHVFRGRKYPDLMEIFAVSYKPDFKLIPKDEEELFCRCTPVKNSVVLPRTGPLPPLLRELVIRDMKKKGQPVKEPRMVMQYKQGLDNVARVESDDTPPTLEIKLDLGKPASPQLYDGVL